MNCLVKIRTAVEEDAEKILNLRKILSSETYYMLKEPNEVSDDIIQYEKNIRFFRESENNLYLVADYNNELVGLLTCSYPPFKRSKHVASFVIGVTKLYWGTGISQELINNMILWCNSENIKRIELEVVEENLRAISLYKKYGFEIEGKKINDHLVSENIFLNTLIMAKHL